VKEIDKLFMNVPIKDERAPSVCAPLPAPTFRACQAGVVEAVAIGFEAGHVKVHPVSNLQMRRQIWSQG